MEQKRQEMISHHWVQEIVSDLNLPPLSSTSLQLTSATVEADVKRVIELAFKLQKRSKKNKLTVDDINLALTTLHQEHVYGLSSSSLVSMNSSEEIIFEDVKITLADYISKPIAASCPQNVDINLHWLAVDGIQPRIPENPELVYYDASADTSSLPREMAYFYSRVTEALLSGDMKSVATVCTLLSDDQGIHDLCGYFSRFIFVHIRRNLKNITTLLSLLRAVESLATNPHVNLEPCLHQILPSVLTCVVASRLGPGSSESQTSRYSSLQDAQISSWGGTHYDLRLYAAKVVSVLVQNYSESYPDLLPRVCKTYLEAIDSTDYLHELAMSTEDDPSREQSIPQKSVGTVYGGIVGLGMLGERVISSVLFSNFHLILQTLSIFSSSSAPRSLPPSSSSTSFKSSSEPVLKKLRTSPASYEDDEGEEGSSVQMHGFTDDIHTRYIVPSYTATSPSITQSMPYIQMKNTENTLLKERISRTGLTQIDGKSLCEYALLSILGWYVMKSLSSAPRLRDFILPSSRRQKNHKDELQISSQQDTPEWLSFIDQRGEHFVPYYVTVSQDLDYCKLFL